MKFVIVAFLIICTFQVYSQPKYEFRAVWVASVANIDWPSKKGLSSEEQKREINQILDLHASLGMNAVIFQVRPEADAFYPSELEPWSRYLTGVPGKSPNPFYDPLQIWIEESHKRGMEFHAWLNPFRVANKFDEPLAANHIAFQHPDWILKYGTKLYFDPGLPEARNFVVKVVKDIVSRYDVDAIHFDDYFYPYPLENDFPDTVSFRKYGRGFRAENKADWRRENVDFLIEMLNDTIKATKSWVKFGISPFGVWRNIADDPRGSNTKAGATNYDHLFADVVKWQENGWIDYLLPQLYWRIGHPLVDFEHLANWWKNHVYGRGMYIGQAPYKIDASSELTAWKGSAELLKQIEIIRAIPEISGSAFFSSKHFNRDLFGFQDSLKNNYYSNKAIVPRMPWIDDVPPKSVTSLKKRGKKLKWESEKTDIETNKPKQFVVYLNKPREKFDPEKSSFVYKITSETEIKFTRINKKKEKYEVRISVLDRLNNESMFSQPVKIKM